MERAGCGRLVVQLSNIAPPAEMPLGVSPARIKLYKNESPSSKRREHEKEKLTIEFPNPVIGVPKSEASTSWNVEEGEFVVICPAMPALSMRSTKLRYPPKAPRSIPDCTENEVNQ